MCPPMRLQFISLCHTEQGSDANNTVASAASEDEVAERQTSSGIEYTFPGRQFIENQCNTRAFGLDFSRPASEAAIYVVTDYEKKAGSCRSTVRSVEASVMVQSLWLSLRTASASVVL